MREAALEVWCSQHLGSPPAATLWELGHLSRVVAFRLADGREVVVKARRWDPALEGCHLVHHHLWTNGFPCPEPITGPVRDGGLAVSAEVHTPGGEPGRGDDPTLTRRSAVMLSQLIGTASGLDPSPSLEPPRPWAGWAHPQASPWPPPDEGPALNSTDACAHLAPMAVELNRRLTGTSLPRVVGHIDWYQGNLRWAGERLVCADDWDSITTLPEAAIVGCAAVSFRPGTPEVHPPAWPGAEVNDTEAFLDQYEQAAGRRFSREETEVAWAAGLWQRLFDAAKAFARGEPERAGDQIRDASARAPHAGLRWRI